MVEKGCSGLGGGGGLGLVVWEVGMGSGRVDEGGGMYLGGRGMCGRMEIIKRSFGGLGMHGEGKAL